MPENLTPADASRIIREMRRDKSYRATEIGGVVGRYIRWFRNEYGARERSVESYESTFSRLAIFHADLAFSDFEPPIGTERLREFIDHFWGDAAPGTRRRVTAELRALFKWAVANGLLVGNPMLTIAAPKARGVERRSHEQDHVRTIIAAQPDLRDRVAIALMARLGLRKNELRLLRWSALDLNARAPSVRIHPDTAKGGVGATLPIVYEDLRLQLEELSLEIGAAPDDFLLYPVRVLRGRQYPAPAKPMSPSGVHRWWDRCLERAEAAHFPMHELRHTAVTEFLRATDGNVALAKKLARHKSINTTIDVYGHLTNEDLAAAMRLVGWDAKE